MKEEKKATVRSGAERRGTGQNRQKQKEDRRTPKSTSLPSPIIILSE